MARTKNDPVFLWLLEQDLKKNKGHVLNETKNEVVDCPSKTEEPWVIARKRIKLSDGATIRIETILNGVRRLNKSAPDGKPIYSVKTETSVEVIETAEGPIEFVILD